MGIQNWDPNCDLSFAVLKGTLTAEPILDPPDWAHSFRCHVDASQKAVGGTLTQLYPKGCERVIELYYQKHYLMLNKQGLPMSDSYWAWYIV